MMQRTQVYFDTETLEFLREEARRKNATLASVIREKVDRSIGKERKTKKRKRKSAAEFLLGLARLGEKLKVNGPKDLAQRIDEFVYR